MSLFRGLTQGLQTGVSLRGQINAQDMQRKQFDQQQQVFQNQLDQQEQAKKLREEGNALNSQLFKAKTLKASLSAGQEIDPKEIAELKKMQIDNANMYSGELINQGAAPGEHKKLTDIVPMGQDENGEALFGFEVSVDGPGGSRKAPITQNRSNDPADPVMVIPKGQYESMIQQRIDEINAQMVAMGNTAPLEQLQAQEAAAAERASERENMKFEQGLNQENMQLQHDLGFQSIEHKAEIDRQKAEEDRAHDIRLAGVSHSNATKLAQMKATAVRNVNGALGPKGASFVAFSEKVGKNTRQYMDSQGNIIDTGVEDERAPSASLEKQIIERMDSANTLKTEIGDIDNVINSISSGGMDGATGKFNAGRFIREQFGTKNQADAIRAKVQGYLNKEVMDSLPPGVASDKDIELAMMGQVSINSNPEELASVLKGIKKSMVIKQRYDDFMANQMSQSSSTLEATRAWQQQSGEILSDIYVSGANGVISPNPLNDITQQKRPGGAVSRAAELQSQMSPTQQSRGLPSQASASGARLGLYGAQSQGGDPAITNQASANDPIDMTGLAEEEQLFLNSLLGGG